MSSGRQGAPDEPDPEPAHPNHNGQGHEHSFGHKQVADIQRARILAAMVDVASGLGAGNATVARVVARSGVSRRTYYELFVDREACFLAAFEETVKQVATVVVPAYEQPGSWRVKIRAALTALLELLDDMPGMSRLLVVEALGAGPRALERRQNVLAQMISIVDQGRAEAKQGAAPPPLTAEGVVGAALSIVHTRMVACPPSAMGAPRAGDERSPRLVDLTNELTSMIVLPYLGRPAARRELERPAPKRARKGRGRSGNPLKDLEMRLTYRTVRVLMAIGAHPGVSNRRVADAADIRDQGQISKLLARLDHLGLIENSGFGQAKGESNSWRLSERGREIEGAIRERTSER
jgi:AcrR family transcriptional regulator/DNA-binding MarR family transcriptional regulator